MLISYDNVQLMKAAKFLNKKNKHAAAWGGVDRIAEQIYNDMVRLAEDILRGGDVSYLSTGGYWIHISRDGESLLFADILVDPAVSKEPDYNQVAVRGNI